MAKKKKQKTFEERLAPFWERIEKIAGTPSQFEAIKKTFVRRPTTFRVNTLQATRSEVEQVLKEHGFKTDRVSWCPEAFILRNKSKRELIDLEIYQEGKIYIQSLASMVPPVVLDPKPGMQVLDLTAAPGSKTSQMAAMMDKQGMLLANDKNKIRFFKLKHNLEMQGVLPNDSDWVVEMRMEHGAHLAEEYLECFDAILVDAPCSAESRFILEEPKTFGYWKPTKIKETAYVQRKLLYAAWQSLRPGGVLVYSTCTFAPEENEGQISKFLSVHDDVEVLPIELPGVTPMPCVMQWKTRTYDERVKHCLRMMPTKDTEGFFVAKLRKMS